MFSAVRRRFTYANVAMTLALVLAMSGGAYAASKYVITSSKQIKPSVLKQLKGKAGANGAQGPSGAAGAQGPAGGPGPQGPQGKEGLQGKEGPKGDQGAPGQNGATGFTATLPSGKTETGAWAVISNEQKRSFFSISFPIPLASAIPFENGHFVTHADVEENKLPTGCSGTAAEPGAAPGNLCIFENGEGEAFQSSAIANPGTTNEGIGATGAAIAIQSNEANENYRGTWAVTAE
jgi:Collagen triple helix repeat (20 copies)